MNSLFLYLLESSVLLILGYGLYQLLLRNETFFSFNRFFLIAILVLSFLLPLINIDIGSSGNDLMEEQISGLTEVRSNYYLALENWSYKDSAKETNSNSE